MTEQIEEVKEQKMPETPKEFPVAALQYYRETDESGLAVGCDLRLQFFKNLTEQEQQNIASEIVMLGAVIACREHKDGFLAGVEEFASELKKIFEKANAV